MRARPLLRARDGSVLGPGITHPRTICLPAPPVRACAGNPVLDDVGTWLKDEITAHFKKIGKPLNLKYIGAACSTRCCAQHARIGWLLLWKRSRACLHLAVTTVEDHPRLAVRIYRQGPAAPPTPPQTPRTSSARRPPTRPTPTCAPRSPSTACTAPWAATRVRARRREGSLSVCEDALSVAGLHGGGSCPHTLARRGRLRLFSHRTRRTHSPRRTLSTIVYALSHPLTQPPTYTPHPPASRPVGFTVGTVDNQIVWLPITVIATQKPRLVDPLGRLYARLCNFTGQPDLSV